VILIANKKSDKKLKNQKDLIGNGTHDLQAGSIVLVPQAESVQLSCNGVTFYTPSSLAELVLRP
jgi:hypothetical protein